MKQFSTSLLAALAFTLLSACQASGPAQPTQISFTRYQPIYLEVSAIEVMEEYKSPMRAPNVEHVMPVPPASAMKQWVNERLRAVGSERTMQVIIKDASVVQTNLPKTEGIKGMFTVDQDRQYEGKLEVEMRIYGGEAMSDANIAINVSRTTTIAENASPLQRDEIMRRLTLQLMEAANAEIERNMFQYFGRFINYSRTP